MPCPKTSATDEISFPCTPENIVSRGSHSPILALVRDLSRLSSSGSFPNDFTCCNELLDLHHMPKKIKLTFRYSLNYSTFCSGSSEYFFLCHFINPSNFCQSAFSGETTSQWPSVYFFLRSSGSQVSQPYNNKGSI